MSEPSPANSPNVSERRRRRKKKKGSDERKGSEENNGSPLHFAMQKFGLSERKKKPKKRISPALTPVRPAPPLKVQATTPSEPREQTERETRTEKEKRVAAIRAPPVEGVTVRRKKSRNDPSLLAAQQAQQKKEEDGLHEETADQDDNKETPDEGDSLPKRTPEKDKHNTSRPLLTDRDPEFPYREQLTNYMEFIEMIKRLGVLGLVAEYNAVKGYQREPMECIAQSSNLIKNRYKDVKCLDHSRVVLKNSETGDYIHANYIRGFPFINDFLCTQGPLPHTICDFWRMAWDENVGYIVMLCELMEGGKKKCERYIPEKAGQYMEMGGFRVTTLIVRTEDQLLHTELLLEKLGTETDKSLRKIYHWQWKEWPDRGVPVSVAPMLRILREVRGSRYRSIVHCSAGVGRTGTLVATEFMLQTIMVRKKGDKILTMMDMIKLIRNQRAQLVQTPAQYVYIAKAVIRQLCIACRNPPDLVQLYANFNAELDVFLKTQGGKGA